MNDRWPISLGLLVKGNFPFKNRCPNKNRKGGGGVGGLCVPRKGDEFFQKRNKPKPCSLVIFLLALVQLLVQAGGGAGKYLDENNNRNQPCWLGSSALVFILHSELNTAMTCFFLTLRCNIKIDFSFIAIVYYSY